MTCIWPSVVVFLAAYGRILAVNDSEAAPGAGNVGSVARPFNTYE